MRKSSSLVTLYRVNIESDDLVKDAQEANSDVTCRGIAEWLKHVALTRLARDGKIIAIGTRWSEKDPMGWLLREQKGWRVLHLPAVSEGAGDPLGRPAGAALWESQYPRHVLETIRIAVGAQVWQSLYQGNPTAAQGTIFKRNWFRHYQTVPEKFHRIVISWDTAFKTGASNDFSVATVWGQTENGTYLLHCWRERVEFPTLKAQVTQLAEAWKPHAILLEDAASGQSLLQELKLATTYPVIGIKPDHDKQIRASAVTAYFEAGKVLFPEGAAWLADFEDELAAFPGAQHDDVVDSTTQALNYLRGETGVYGVLELMKKGWDGFAGSWQNVKQEFRHGYSESKAVEAPFAQEQTGCAHLPELVHMVAGGQLRCNQCGAQWWPECAPKIPRITRADYLAGRVSVRNPSSERASLLARWRSTRRR